MSPAIDSLSRSPAFVSAMWGMALLDKDARFLKANHKFCQLLERNEAELVGVALSSFIVYEDLLAFTSAVENARSGDDQPDEIVCRLFSKSSRIRPAKMIVQRLNDDTNDFLCFFSQATEIDPIVPRAVQAQTIEWKPFFKQNWKQIITMLAIVGGWAINGYVQYREMQRTVIDNQDAIVKLTASVDRTLNILGEMGD